MWNPLFTVDVEYKLVQPLWKTVYGGVSKNKKIEPPCGPTILLLGVHPKEMNHYVKGQKSISIPRLAATTCAVARVLKRPACLSLDELNKENVADIFAQSKYPATIEK